jgi:prevent-host-death family protein
MSRTVVGARELKTKLGTYLRRVREGDTFLVTERGSPVAELCPIKPTSGIAAALMRLSLIGAVTLPRRRSLGPFRPLRSKEGRLSQAIIEEREDRF